MVAWNKESLAFVRHDEEKMRTEVPRSTHASLVAGLLNPCEQSLPMRQG